MNHTIILPPRAMSKKTTGLIGFPSLSVMLAEGRIADQVWFETRLWNLSNLVDVAVV